MPWSGTAADDLAPPPWDSMVESGPGPAMVLLPGSSSCLCDEDPSGIIGDDAEEGAFVRVEEDEGVGKF